MSAKAKYSGEGLRVVDLACNLDLHIAFRHEHGQWFARLFEPDITGCGDTRSEALAELLALLADYVRGDDGKMHLARPLP